MNHMFECTKRLGFQLTIDAVWTDQLFQIEVHQKRANVLM